MFTQILLNSLILLFKLCLALDRRNGLELEKRLPGSILLTMHGESLMACQDSCSNRPRCKSLNYHRLSHQCELMSASSGSSGMAEDKSGWIHQSNPEWETEDVCKCPENGVCDTSSRECAIQECEKISDTTHSRTLGNTNSVGARVVRACPRGQYPVSPETISEWPITSQCQENGTWTTWDLECNDYTVSCHEYLVSENNWTRYLYKEVPLVSGACGVPDSSLKASSVYDGSEFAVSNAKFDKAFAWVAADYQSEHYIEVEFASVLEVHRIATQGRRVLDQYVSKFEITYSESSCSSSSFNLKASNEAGQNTFDGNWDDTTIKENKIIPSIKARCVRINIISYHEKVTYPSMKFELYGRIKLPIL